MVTTSLRGPRELEPASPSPVCLRRLLSPVGTTAAAGPKRVNARLRLPRAMHVDVTVVTEVTVCSLGNDYAAGRPENTVNGCEKTGRVPAFPDSGSDEANKSRRRCQG